MSEREMLGTTVNGVERTPFIAIKETARLLGGITPRAVRYMIDAGTLSSTHVEGRRMVIRASYEQYVQARIDAATPPAEVREGVGMAQTSPGSGQGSGTGPRPPYPPRGNGSA